MSKVYVKTIGVEARVWVKDLMGNEEDDCYSQMMSSTYSRKT